MWEEAAVTADLFLAAPLCSTEEGRCEKVLGRQRDEKGTGPGAGEDQTRGSHVEPRAKRREEKHPLSPQKPQH